MLSNKYNNTITQPKQDWLETDNVFVYLRGVQFTNRRNQKASVLAAYDYCHHYNNSNAINSLTVSLFLP